MEKFVGAAKPVPFASIYLDGNNPRLALDDQPGYQDPKKLFDLTAQPRLEKIVSNEHDIAVLQLAIESQGWMPIDNMVVWEHPKAPGKHVIVEGNRRFVALRRIRARLEKEREKFDKMKDGGRKRLAPHDLKRQERLVTDLARVVADTDQLSVVPLAAKTVDELERKLPRVLAVRHITGARMWGNYAEDLWLLIRYTTLFEIAHSGEDIYWDQSLIERVANEAAISPLKTRRQILAASCFSHFKVRFEDELPKGEKFEPSDYYLFENIVKKPFLRDQFGLEEGMMHLPDEREDVLFQWTFSKPRGRTADDNPNIFYRHENLLLWDQMKRYDGDHNTGFAKRFDIDDPDSAPRMGEVEAAWRVHKESRQPGDIIEQLLQQLEKLDTKTLVSEGAFLRKQLENLQQHTGKVLKMIEAASAKAA